MCKAEKFSRHQSVSGKAKPLPTSMPAVKAALDVFNFQTQSKRLCIPLIFIP